MRYLIVGLTLALGAGAGCATPARIEAGAAAHDQRAAELEAQGDYARAASERAAAERQRQKAANRSQWMTF
jgi:hypothetical protein